MNRKNLARCELPPQVSLRGQIASLLPEVEPGVETSVPKVDSRARGGEGHRCQGMR
ncbi:MAG: hypothetical protein PUP91_13650 [Rhizonema sp. PD37]|nr:hypothetical protein [Rhizonema sp. PD37]